MIDMADKQDNTTPKASGNQVDNHYEIEKLTDIFQIPEASFDNFIEDLRSYYSVGNGLIALIKASGKALGTPVDIVPSKMTWIDDGKHEARVYIKQAKGTDLQPSDQETITEKAEAQ